MFVASQMILLCKDERATGPQCKMVFLISLGWSWWSSEYDRQGGCSFCFSEAQGRCSGSVGYSWRLKHAAEGPQDVARTVTLHGAAQSSAAGDHPGESETPFCGRESVTLP